MDQVRALEAPVAGEDAFLRSWSAGLPGSEFRSVSGVQMIGSSVGRHAVMTRVGSGGEGHFFSSEVQFTSKPIGPGLASPRLFSRILRPSLATSILSLADMAVTPDKVP
jgi:hypothetical protein